LKGKTTTISMLTGLYPPTSGLGLVGGYDIRTEIDQVHWAMGLCPQFDVLWDDLTPKEHLLFYARIKVPLPRTALHFFRKSFTFSLFSL
jgi:ABC-type multidrug transport system ATPase subunit